MIDEETFLNYLIPVFKPLNMFVVIDTKGLKRKLSRKLSPDDSGGDDWEVCYCAYSSLLVVYWYRVTYGFSALLPRWENALECGGDRILKHCISIYASKS